MPRRVPVRARVRVFSREKKRKRLQRAARSRDAKRHGTVPSQSRDESRRGRARQRSDRVIVRCAETFKRPPHTAEEAEGRCEPRTARFARRCFFIRIRRRDGDGGARGVEYVRHLRGGRFGVRQQSRHDVRGGGALQRRVARRGRIEHRRFRGGCFLVRFFVAKLDFGEETRQFRRRAGALVARRVGQLEHARLEKRDLVALF